MAKVKKFFIYTILLFLTCIFGAYQAAAQTPEGAVHVIKQKQQTSDNISEMSGLEYEMLIFEKRADLLLNKVDDLLKENEQLRSKNNEYSRQLAVRESGVDKVRNELTQEIETIKKELAQELSANKQLKETLAGQTNDIKSLKEQLTAKEKKVSSLASDSSTKERQAATELAAKENLLKEKTEALSSLEKEQAAIKEASAKSKEELAAIQKKLDAREEEFRILKNQLGKQKDTFSTDLEAKDKLAKGKDAQLGDLDRENKQHKREIAAYLSTIDQLKEKLQVSHNQIADLQKKLVAKAKPAELSSQKPETKTQEMASNVAALEEKLNQQRSTIDTLEKRLAEKQRSEETAAGVSSKPAGETSAETGKELEIKSAQLKELNAKLTSRDDELFALQKKLLSIQQQLASLKADEGSKTYKATKKDEQIAKLTSQLNAAQERFEKATLDDKRKIERLESELVNTKKSASQQPKEPSASPRGEQVVSKNTGKESSSEKEKELNFLHTRLQEARLAHQELSAQMKQQKEDYEAQIAGLKKQLASRSAPASGLVPQEQSAVKGAEAGVTEVQDEALSRVNDTLQKAFQDEIANQHIRLSLNKDNLVVSVLSDSLFDSGSDEIKLSSIPILNTIGKVLNNEAQDFQIVVEGHTDNQPIRYSQWKSNWELSSARALSVLHYFINECGISSSRLSLVGFGEFKPVAGNDTEAGRQSNRRVEIILIPHDGVNPTSSL